MAKTATAHTLDQTLSYIKQADTLVLLSKPPRKYQHACFPPLWQSDTTYNIGDIIRPSTWNGFVYECTGAGTSGSQEPGWATNDGDVTTDNTVTWVAHENYTLAADSVSETEFSFANDPPLWQPNTSYQIGNRVTGSFVYDGLVYECTAEGTSGDTEPVWPLEAHSQTIETWQADTSYTQDTLVRPTTPNGFVYKCITAGTSGSSEPDWNTEIGGTTNDGTVVWETHYDDIITDGTVTWKTIDPADLSERPRRVVTMAKHQNILIHNTGKATHIALLDDANKKIVLVLESLTAQNLYQGYVADLESWEYYIWYPFGE